MLPVSGIAELSAIPSRTSPGAPRGTSQVRIPLEIEWEAENMIFCLIDKKANRSGLDADLGGGALNDRNFSFRRRTFYKSEPRWRRQRSDLRGVLIKQLQPLHAGGIKLVVNILGQVATHVCLAQSYAWPPVAADLVEVFRLQPMIPRLLKDPRQVRLRLGIVQCRRAHRPKREHKRLARMANPFLGQIERKVSGPFHLQRRIADQESGIALR